jgi:plastocyanin
MTAIEARTTLIIMISLILVVSLLPATASAQQQQQQQQTTGLSMTGQQYFGNGTGVAYFNDGTTASFNHTITPDNGYYFDNSTVFHIGEIPGIASGNGVQCGENATFSGVNITDISIIRGANLIENKSRALEPSPIVKIKAGDTVRWTNEDITLHSIISPPTSPPLSSASSFSGLVPAGSTFSSGTIIEGGRFYCTFTEPGGIHYGIDYGGSSIKGAVIVEEK